MKKYILLTTLVLFAEIAKGMEEGREGAQLLLSSVKFKEQIDKKMEDKYKPFSVFYEKKFVIKKNVLETIKDSYLNPLDDDWEFNEELVNWLEMLYEKCGPCNEEIIKIYNDNNNNNTFAFKEKIVGFPFANSQKTIADLLTKFYPVLIKYWKIISMHDFDLNEPLNDGDTLKEKVAILLGNSAKKPELIENCVNILTLIKNNDNKERTGKQKKSRIRVYNPDPILFKAGVIDRI